MYMKTLVCLANSRKRPAGRCIAGKEITDAGFGDWIRPISVRPGHEVSDDERRYETGAYVRLLDKVTICFKHASATAHQVENHVLDDNYYFGYSGRATWHDVLAALDKPDPVFWMPSYHTCLGLNDKVPPFQASKFNCSLKLIRADDLKIKVTTEPGYEGSPTRRRVRGNFSHLGNQYQLSVTDPEIEEYYLQMKDGQYGIADAALCISISERFRDHYYRLITSIITPQRTQPPKPRL